MPLNISRIKQNYASVLAEAKGSLVRDFHSHTTASDGSLSPKQLVLAAKRAGVKTIAITDHDSTSGVDEAVAEGKKLGVNVIAGVELTAHDYETGKKVEVKGLGIDHGHPAIKNELAKLQAYRKQYAQKIIAKLRERGFEIPARTEKQFVQNCTITRGTISKRLLLPTPRNRALFEKMFGKEMQPAAVFQELLGAGKPAHVQWEYRFSVQAAIKAVKAAGGLADIAHPGVSGLEQEDLERYKKMGAQSIEIYHPRHTPAQVKKYEKIAIKLGLGTTSGTDFHY